MDFPTQSGAVFSVFVKPNAHETTVVGYDEARKSFVVRIAAVPDKGKANDELLRVLKKDYGIVCELLSGHTSRKKLLRIC